MKIDYAHGCSAQHTPGIACKHGPCCFDCIAPRCLGAKTTASWRLPKAQHSSTTPEHGTPPHIVEGARNLMGGIDLDPASSAFWNKRVRAKKFYTEKDDGLAQPWKGRVFLNPPGDRSGKLVQAFWLRLVEHYFADQIEQAIWVGFSVEQFVTLQGIKDTEGATGWIPSPLTFPTLIPSRRLHYQVKTGRTSKRSTNPPHASYITWLPPRWRLKGATVQPSEWNERMNNRFADEVGYLGTIARST